MPGGRPPGFRCQVRSPMEVDDGTLCLAPSPFPPHLGAAGDHDGVASWDVSRKLIEAARRAGPRLPDTSRALFEALFSPANLGITSAVLGAWGASHLTGLGEAGDAI